MTRIDLIGYGRGHHVGLPALMFALGGASDAAVRLSSYSVGTAQLQNGAVTQIKLSIDAVASPRIKDHSLLARDFKPGQLPASPRGVSGPTGAQCPAGPQGVKGPIRGQGPVGQSSPKGNSFDTLLPSGKTLRGADEVTGTASSQGGQFAAISETYAAELAAAPQLHMIADRPPVRRACPHRRAALRDRRSDTRGTFARGPTGRLSHGRATAPSRYPTTTASGGPG